MQFHPGHLESPIKPKHACLWTGHPEKTCLQDSITQSLVALILKTRLLWSVTDYILQSNPTNTAHSSASITQLLIHSLTRSFAPFTQCLPPSLPPSTLCRSPRQYPSPIQSTWIRPEMIPRGDITLISPHECGGPLCYCSTCLRAIWCNSGNA